jgi:hypothetical protein
MWRSTLAQPVSPKVPPPGGAGVVDEHVELSAVLALHDVANASRCVGFRQIGGDHGRVPQFAGERPQTVLTPGDEHELRVGVAAQPPRRRLADAAGGSGYQCDVGHVRREPYPCRRFDRL